MFRKGWSKYNFITKTQRSELFHHFLRLFFFFLRRENVCLWQRSRILMISTLDNTISDGICFFSWVVLQNFCFILCTFTLLFILAENVSCRCVWVTICVCSRKHRKMPELTSWIWIVIARMKFWCLLLVPGTDETFRCWWLVSQRCQCTVSRGTGWRVTWRMVSPSEKLWDGAVSVVPQKSCMCMAEEFASKLSTGELTEFCSTLFFSKTPETGIICETGSFYLKICHGMFLTVALFLSSGGRNMWKEKHEKEHVGNWNKQASHYSFYI